MQNLNFKKLDIEVRETLRKRKEDNILFSSTNLNKLTSEISLNKKVFDNDSFVGEYYCCDSTEYRHTEFSDITFGIETAGPINFNKNEKREVNYASEAYSAFNELFENNKNTLF
ncbi:MAG TPA: hypothetical protein VIK72_18155 [Clostridiaceae bacterium]